MADTNTELIAKLTRAHRVSSSDPDDPTRATLYGDAASALETAQARLDRVREIVQGGIEDHGSWTAAHVDPESTLDKVWDALEAPAPAIGPGQGSAKLAGNSAPASLEAGECGKPSPLIDLITCTRPSGHDHECTSVDYPEAGQWPGDAVRTASTEWAVRFLADWAVVPMPEAEARGWVERHPQDEVVSRDIIEVAGWRPVSAEGDADATA